MAAGTPRRGSDGRRPGNRPAARRRGAHPGPTSTWFDVWSPPVLDLVLVAAVVALFALVGAVAAGVEKL